jgi:hypothetical protein
MYQSWTDRSWTNRAWNIFWKLFGTVILVLLVIGVIGGAVTQSADFTSMLVLRTFAAALGVCGIIGFGAIPVEMYLEDRNRRKNTHAVE